MELHQRCIKSTAHGAEGTLCDLEIVNREALSKASTPPLAVRGMFSNQIETTTERLLLTVGAAGCTMRLEDSGYVTSTAVVY